MALISSCRRVFKYILFINLSSLKELLNPLWQAKQMPVGLQITHCLHALQVIHSTSSISMSMYYMIYDRLFIFHPFLPFPKREFQWTEPRNKTSSKSARLSEHHRGKSCCSLRPNKTLHNCLGRAFCSMDLQNCI